MSSTFSKNKEKRPRSSSEPNKSFVKNVTSRVSGLLPATITKWFSSPSSSNTNGSAQTADATDSSTEDEAPEGPVTIQPPAKRMRYNSGDFNNSIPVEMKCTSTNTDTIDTFITVQSPPAIMNYKRESSYMHIPLQTTNDEYIGRHVQEPSYISTETLPSANEQSVIKKRKCIFNPDYSIDSIPRTPTIKPEGPQFNPDIYCSLFYSGRTNYGGASLSNVSHPHVLQRDISLMNETTSNDDSVNMSHSARRVMDLLENYSSPIAEAKRIPPVERNSNNTSNNSSRQWVCPYGPKVVSYKTQELHMPSVANILTIKRRSRLMNTTNVARQIIASHSSTSDYSPYPETYSRSSAVKDDSGDKFTTKLKTRLTRANREHNFDTESSSSSPVPLPTAVLHIDQDNLPKFTFAPTTSTQAPQATSIQTTVIIAPESFKQSIEHANTTTLKTNEVVKDTEESCDDDDYLFSSPVRVSTESTKTPSTPPKYTFGSPERKIEKADGVEKKETNVPAYANEQRSVVSGMISADWKCTDCWYFNKSESTVCSCCGVDKSYAVLGNGEPKQCSVCNKEISQDLGVKCNDCTNKEKASTSKMDNKPPPPVVKQTSSKWKCNDCWVENDQVAEKCVCCSGAKPGKAPPPTITPTSNNIESEWKCDVCWIKNKDTLEKCAACATPKPGSKSGSTSSTITTQSKNNNETPVTSDTTFKSLIKAQGDRWECPHCLVRNDGNRSNCVCCEADKPGSTKEGDKKPFNFHQPSEITFKFGIQYQENSIKFNDAPMGDESETNNNIPAKAPTFSFGIPSQKSVTAETNTVTPMENSQEEPPKLNFTFGIPKPDTAPPASNCIFGASTKLPEASKNNTEAKPEEVPQVLTLSSPSTAPSKPMNLFGSLVTPAVVQDKPPLMMLPDLNQSPTNKKEVASNSANVPTTNAQQGFTFLTVKPPSTLFAAPTTTTTSSISIPHMQAITSNATSENSLFSKGDPSTSTPTMALFQNNNSTPASTVSLFSNTETVTTATISLAPAQPVFSFGGQSTGLPQTMEKPKFNFSFGSKTDTQSMFKPPTFGATIENNLSAVKFNLSSSNVTGGNGLSGNPLSSAPQINAPNTVTNPTAGAMFGSNVQNENVWSSNCNMLFGSNAPNTSVQKPATFTFGGPTSFNSPASPFGSNMQPQPPQPPQPAQPVFGIQSQTSQPPMFGNSMQSQPTPNMFGSPQPPSNPMPMGMFSTPNMGGAPTFGPNPPIPTFETATISPVQPPAFNFGAPQPTFGFGQQQQMAVPSQPDGQVPVQIQQPSIYSFGASAGGQTPLQFTMGSAPNNPANTGRRVIRKAMRRTQR